MDAVRAGERWKKDCAKDMMQTARLQREKMNSLHERADNLEDHLQGLLSQEHQGKETDLQKKQCLTKLQALQDEIDSAVAPGEFKDKPASVIQKAASQKVARLISLLEPPPQQQ